MYLWGFSDIHHLNGDWHPAQCCHAPAPQSSALPGGHHGLLLPPGPQAEEDLSWLCDTSREGTAEHRSQTWGQKVWNIIWLGLGALHCQWMPPACPLPWDLAYYNPQYFTDEHSLTFQTLYNSTTRTRNLMVKVNYSFTGLWGQAPLDTHSSFVQFWVPL